MNSQSSNAPTRLESHAQIMSVPAGWTAEYVEPDRWSDDPDPEKLEITNDGCFSREVQSHGELPVTGAQVTIRKSDYGESMYETTYSLRINDVDIKTRRLVRAKVSECSEWAHRIIYAIDNTPNGWIPMPPESGQMNRWVTLDGSEQIELWQEDRDNLEAREYRVLKRPSDHIRVNRCEVLAEELYTADLYNSVIELMSDMIEMESDSTEITTAAP